MKREPLVVNRYGEVWSPKGLVGDVNSKTFQNALGAEQQITTLTQLLPQIIEQKYYELPIADYVDVQVGGGNPFASELFNWTTSIAAGDFESGLINMASHDSQRMADDIAVEPIKRPVTSWAKNVQYNILQEGTFNAGTGNMDLIQAKYAARKKDYDLGIQKLAFLGLQTNTAFKGLLNQTGVTANTTLITKTLSSMTAAEFDAVVQGLLSAYMANCNYTSIPNRFVIPASDFYGLTAQMSATYPLKTKLEVLENALKQATGKEDFKVMPLAYADTANNNIGSNVYVLYRKAPDTVIMNVPLDFTVTLPNTADGFNYVSTAYSRFTGVTALRPREILYFTF